MNNDTNVVAAKNLTKSFGDVKVLKGININVQRGQILALLGPNGAGKTTTIRILSTLLKYDSGSASINGHDIEKDPDEVRASIGLTGQFAAVDEYLTAEENLQMMGRLYRLKRKEVERRTKQLLKDVDLVESSTRPVKTYSGGMKRRVDLAMSLIAEPPVIFLDEPTTGLDPRSRQKMWEMIKKLAANGTAILLTTQYMDEADNLADNVIVIDGGKVIAEGTPSQLKNKVGAEQLEVTISQKSDFEDARKEIGGRGGKVDEERRVISLATKQGVATVRDVLQKLENAKIEVENVSLHQPTLDDVFMKLTGHGAASEKPHEKKGKK